MCHLVWQMASGYLAVIKSSTRRHMQCDNQFLRCAESDESINHVIFECPHALQTWALALTSSFLYQVFFLIWIIYSREIMK